MDVSPLLLWAHLGLALAAPPPPDAGEGILYLVPAHPNGIDAAALVEAVGIYTRDLQLAVRVVTDEAPATTATAAPRMAELVRARGARVAFWCVPAGDGRSVVLFSVDGGGVWREDRVPFNVGTRADFHRAVALKLRAILTSAARELDPGAGSAAPPAESKTATATATAAPAPPATTVAATPPVPVASARWALGLQYILAAAPGYSLAPRQSLGLEIAVGPRWPLALELFLGGRVARAQERTVPDGTISVVDVPLRLGARWVGGGRRVALALGLFGAFELWSASARSTTGDSSQRWIATGGGGAEALVRVPASGRWSLELTAWAEAVSPRTRFFVTESSASSAIETGRYLAGVALGPVFSTR